MVFPHQIQEIGDVATWSLDSSSKVCLCLAVYLLTLGHGVKEMDTYSRREFAPLDNIV
jgi:hypothetical protein